MDEITLRETCKKLNVSRRAIQGYEKAELIAPSGKNYRGYLLYDLKTQERIREIKLFQEMGFSIIEIKKIIDSPKEELRIILENQIEKMYKDIEQKENIIQSAKEYIKML